MDDIGEPGASDTAAGQATFEMANLRPERTGLPFVVFVSQRGGARHGVRIKLARSPRVRPAEMITVALRPAPRVIRGRLDANEFALVRRWIEINTDVLVDYWNGDIAYTEDAMDALKKLPETARP
ncbi:MAG: hypothetical protein AB7T18_03515 [Alphaproteobacteria bacterium]